MHSFLCKLYWARDISTKSQCISMLLYVRSLYSAFFFPLKVLFLNVLDENKSAYMFRKNLLSLWSTVHTANFASTTQTCGSYTLFPSPDFLCTLVWGIIRSRSLFSWQIGDENEVIYFKATSENERKEWLETLRIGLKKRSWSSWLYICCSWLGGVNRCTFIFSCYS